MSVDAAAVNRYVASPYLGFVSTHWAQKSLLTRLMSFPPRHDISVGMGVRYEYMCQLAPWFLHKGHSCRYKQAIWWSSTPCRALVLYVGRMCAPHTAALTDSVRKLNLFPDSCISMGLLCCPLTAFLQPASLYDFVSIPEFVRYVAQNDSDDSD